MRAVMYVILSALLMAGLMADDRKLTFEERIEIMRGMTAEYATAKVLLPRSKKPLPIESDGAYDKRAWEDVHREHGPAARKGDLVQITKVEIDSGKITFEINGGYKSGKKWYERVEVGTGSRTSPIGQSGNPTLGTTLELRFAKGVPPLDAAEVKKILSTVFDFEKRSVTEQYVESLPPAVQEAIKKNTVIEGMTRDQVLLAVGRPVRKLRETKDGLELEEWVYGHPPGKITFVTFHNEKVTKVKNAYAGLGGAVADPNAPTVR